MLLRSFPRVYGEHERETVQPTERLDLKRTDEYDDGVHGEIEFVVVNEDDREQEKNFQNQ